MWQRTIAPPAAGSSLGAARVALAQRFMGDKQLPTIEHFAQILHRNFLVEFFTYLPESESL